MDRLHLKFGRGTFFRCAEVIVHVSNLFHKKSHDYYLIYNFTDYLNYLNLNQEMIIYRLLFG